MSFDDDVMNYQPGATVQDVARFLQEFCFEHPDLATRELHIATECGMSGAGIKTPVCLAVHKNSRNSVCLVTEDDREYDEFYYHIFEDKDLGVIDNDR